MESTSYMNTNVIKTITINNVTYDVTTSIRKDIASTNESVTDNADNIAKANTEISTNAADIKAIGLGMYRIGNELVKTVTTNVAAEAIQFNEFNTDIKTAELHNTTGAEINLVGLRIKGYSSDIFSSTTYSFAATPDRDDYVFTLASPIQSIPAYGFVTVTWDNKNTPWVGPNYGMSGKKPWKHELTNSDGSLITSATNYMPDVEGYKADTLCVYTDTTGKSFGRIDNGSYWGILDAVTLGATNKLTTSPFAVSGDNLASPIQYANLTIETLDKSGANVKVDTVDGKKAGDTTPKLSALNIKAEGGVLNITCASAIKTLKIKGLAKSAFSVSDLKLTKVAFPSTVTTLTAKGNDPAEYDMTVTAKAGETISIKNNNKTEYFRITSIELTF